MKKEARREARRWLEQAEIDLETAEYNLEGKKYYLTCFLAQQIAEKALKAFLYLQGEEIVLGHSVAHLCERAKKYDSKLKHLSGEISMLDGYYLPTRYPNSIPDSIPAKIYNRKSAEGALELARKTVNFIRKRVRK